jgi:hypothetical protein
MPAAVPFGLVKIAQISFSNRSKLDSAEALQLRLAADAKNLVPGDCVAAPHSTCPRTPHVR